MKPEELSASKKEILDEKTVSINPQILSEKKKKPRTHTYLEKWVGINFPQNMINK